MNQAQFDLVVRSLFKLHAVRPDKCGCPLLSQEALASLVLAKEANAILAGDRPMVLPR